MRRLKSREKGFTLIEIMIVLGIIGGVIALSMPYITNRSSQNKKFLREFTVLSRELHTRAKLNGVVYRLVIDMQGEDPNAPKTEQKYWVEKANAGSVIKPDEEGEALKEAQEKDDEKKPDPRGFEMDKTILKGPKTLPSGMTFDQVELARLKTPVTTGKAFIHYMPQGLVDEAAVHIKGQKTQEWTISIHPLTGRAEIISKTVSLHDISEQQ